MARSVTLAPDRWRYLWTRGWLDLLGSLPVVVFPPLRVLRIVRLLGLACQLRRHGTWQRLRARAAENTLLVTIFTLLVMVVVASIVVSQVERNATGSNIHSASDALWWAIVTVTTVGFGDYFPVTGAGRVAATFLMIGGVGLFGVLSSYLTSTLVQGRTGHARTGCIACRAGGSEAAGAGLARRSAHWWRAERTGYQFLVWQRSITLKIRC